DERIDRVDRVGPGARGGSEPHALLDLAFLADLIPDARELVRYLLVHLQHVVECERDFAIDADDVHRQAHAEIALPEGAQCTQQRPAVERIGNKSKIGHGHPPWKSVFGLVRAALHAADHGDRLVELDGLVEEIIGTIALAHLTVLRLDEIRQHDDLGSRTAALKVPQQADPVARGVQRIEDREIRLQSDRKLARHGDVFRLAHNLDSRKIPQMIRQSFPERRRVVRYQHAHMYPRDDHRIWHAAPLSRERDLPVADRRLAVAEWLRDGLPAESR